MSRQRLSEHLVLEIEAGRLEPGQPVPGCVCYRCILQTFGLNSDALYAAEALVRDLIRFDPASRLSVAAPCVESWSAQGLRLPSAAVLAELAHRVPHARRNHPSPSSDDLPVEAARAVPIIDVAKRLGIKLRRMGQSWRGPCPIHGGDGPNFSIDPERGMFKCFVCDAAGDAIALEQEVSGAGFVEAVRRLAG